MAEGMKMNHSYRTCRRQKRQKVGLCHRTGLVFPRTSALGWEQAGYSDEDFERLGHGARLAE